MSILLLDDGEITWPVSKHTHESTGALVYNPIQLFYMTKCQCGATGFCDLVEYMNSDHPHYLTMNWHWREDIDYDLPKRKNTDHSIEYC